MKVDSFPEGPRKVIVATTLFSLFEGTRPYRDLPHRLAEVKSRLNEMSEAARAQYGRGLDIAVFPENVLNGRTGGTLAERSVLLDETLRAELGAMAKENGCWLVVCFNMREDAGKSTVYNASLLFDRQGRLACTYRKIHLALDPDGITLEGGKCPGTEPCVFTTDFGRVGLMICFDLGYDELAAAYAAQGVDLILWSTMSPQTVLPRAYARRFGYYIVSATPRDNASVFDPMGEIVAQVESEGVLVSEIDLDYRLVHWQKALENGQALAQRFGNRVGFRYSDREDFGIFWSNDPGTTIGAMLREAGIKTDAELRHQAAALCESSFAAQLRKPRWH